MFQFVIDIITVIAVTVLTYVELLFLFNGCYEDRKKLGRLVHTLQVIALLVVRCST